MKPLLILLLVLSASVNVYLWRHQPVQSAKTPPAQSPEAITLEHKSSQSLNQNTKRLSESFPEGELKQLNAWLDEDDPRFYPALLEVLKRHPNNWSLLMLETRWIYKTKPLSYAIIHNLDLLDDHPPSPFRETLDAMVNQRLSDAISQLTNAKDWDTLARFLEPLYQYSPRDKSFTLLLAEAYGSQSRLSLMESVLASLDRNDEQAEQLRARFYSSANAELSPPQLKEALPYEEESTGTRIVVRHVSDHYIVPIRLNGVDTQLLLDTGASITSVSENWLQSHLSDTRYRFVGNFNVNTAGGAIKAEMIMLERIEIGPYELQEIPILVLPNFSDANSQGLLGMNILKRFDFQLDPYNNELVLRLFQ